MGSLEAAEQDKESGGEEGYSQDPGCTGQEGSLDAADQGLGIALNSAPSFKRLNYAKRAKFYLDGGKNGY